MTNEKISAIDLIRLLPKIEDRLKTPKSRNLRDGLSVHDLPPLQIAKKLAAELPFSRDDIERIMGLFGFLTPGYHLKIFSEEGKGGFFAILWNGYDEPKSIHDAIGTLSVDADQDGVYKMRWAGISSGGIMAAQYEKSTKDGDFYLMGIDVSLNEKDLKEIPKQAFDSLTNIKWPYQVNAGFITMKMAALTNSPKKLHFFPFDGLPKEPVNRFVASGNYFFPLENCLTQNSINGFVQVKIPGQKPRDTVPFKIKQKIG